MNEIPRWWIVSPLGHRAYAAETVPDEVEFLGQMVPVIRTPTPDLDDWVCDWCGDPIPLEAEVDGETRPQIVPMYGSNALCPKCLIETMRSEHLPPDPNAWSQMNCACPPCKNGWEMVQAWSRLHRSQ